MERDLDTSLFRVLWPPHYHAPAPEVAAGLTTELLKENQREADLNDAATRIAGAAFEASGQQCISAQRVIVERPVFDRFLELFIAAAKKLYAPRADFDPIN